jgi:hypothetical protein
VKRLTRKQAEELMELSKSIKETGDRYMGVVDLSKGPEKLAGGASSAVVLAYTHQHGGGNGMRPHGVVLCFLPNNYDPFVTWRAYYDAERKVWYAELGHYCRSIFTAVADYADRGGK